jgi:hypothetical protein
VEISDIQDLRLSFVVCFSRVIAALKYSTTFPVIFLSGLKYHVELPFWFSRLRPLWVLCAILNSCYSFWWDITKDWDLGFVPYLLFLHLLIFLYLLIFLEHIAKYTEGINRACLCMRAILMSTFIKKRFSSSC